MPELFFLWLIKHLSMSSTIRNVLSCIINAVSSPPRRDACACNSLFKNCIVASTSL